MRSALTLLLPALVSAYVFPLTPKFGLGVRTCIPRQYVQGGRMFGKNSGLSLDMQLGREVSDKGLSGYSGVVSLNNFHFMFQNDF